MKTKLCKSHISHLQKVVNQLSYRQTMSFTTLILSEENNSKLIDAKDLICEAIRKLDQIQ